MIEAIQGSLAGFEWWKLLYWAIGTFGVGGTIAVAVAFPSAIPFVLKVIEFLFGYRIVCAVTALVLGAVIADYHRHSVDDAEHAAAVVAFEQKQVERDKRIAQETKDEVWKEIADQTALNTTADTEVKELQHEFSPVPHTADNPFRIGAYAGRLRAVYGQTGGRSKGVNRAVPAARRSGVRL